MVSLATEISYVEKCNGRLVFEATTSIENVVMGVVDIVVLLTCLASLILCCRAVIRAQFLKQVGQTRGTIDIFRAVLTPSNPVESGRSGY